jgi:hypothetical protein
MHCVIERAISSHICVDLLKRKKKKKISKQVFFKEALVFLALACLDHTTEVYRQSTAF